VTEVIRNPTYR